MTTEIPAMPWLWTALTEDQVMARLEALLSEFPPAEVLAPNLMQPDHPEATTSTFMSPRDQLRAALMPLRASKSILDLLTPDHLAECEQLVRALRRYAAQSSSGMSEVSRLFHLAMEVQRASNPLKPRASQIGLDWRRILIAGIQEFAAGVIDAPTLLEAVEQPVRREWSQVPPKARALMSREIALAVQAHPKAAARRGELEELLTIPSAVGDGATVTSAGPRRTRLRPAAPSDVSCWSAEFAGPEYGRVRSALSLATSSNSVELVVSTLAPLEDQLNGLLLRDCASALKVCPPTFDLLSEDRQPYPEFEQARQDLKSSSTRSRGLEQMRHLYLRLAATNRAKEWYAYALLICDFSANRTNATRLFEELSEVGPHAQGLAWTARNNLALLQHRAGDWPAAARTLFPAIENGYHPAEILEVALRLAIEVKDGEMRDLLVQHSSHRAANVLDVLRAARRLCAAPAAERSESETFWRRVGSLFSDDWLVFSPPNVRVETTPAQTEDIAWGFIQSGRLTAGIAFFRERLAVDAQRNRPENWRALAELLVRTGREDAAWKVRSTQWSKAGQRNPTDRLRNKSDVLKASLELGRQKDALGLLLGELGAADLPESEFERWRRILSSGAGVGSGATNPATATHNVGVEVEDTQLDAARVIQDLAGSFSDIRQLQSFAARADDAWRLLRAAKAIHPDLPARAVDALELLLTSIPRLGERSTDIQSISRQLLERSGDLEIFKESRWYYLQGLAAAARTAIESLSAISGGFQDVTFEPPAALGLAYFLSPTPYTSRVAIRVTNPGAVAFEDMIVTFTSDSAAASFPRVPIQVGCLAGRASTVVESEVALQAFGVAVIPATATIAWSVSSIPRTRKHRFEIRLVPSRPHIPYSLRYVTTGPIYSDRSDLCRGRDDNLKDLAAAFAGGRMTKLNFVNGIRGVGKSTLLENLASHCEERVEPLVLNLESAMGEGITSAAQLVNALMEKAETALLNRHVLREALRFELVPAGVDPWNHFEAFLQRLRGVLAVPHILLCLDELQAYVKKAQDQSNAIEGGLLNWLRDKASEHSDLFIVCTGSEPYDVMTGRFGHSIWGKEMSMMNVSFVERGPTLEIAQQPVAQDGVVYLDETQERLWDLTQGHPWVTQLIAQFACRILNAERRRVVLPRDLDRAAQGVSTERHLVKLWWNEKDGFLDAQHREVARLILDNQSSPRAGVSKQGLAEMVRGKGLGDFELLRKRMEDVEVLSEVTVDGESRYRIRSGYLESGLPAVIGALSPGARPRDVFLGIDWENFWLGMRDVIDVLPPQQVSRARYEMNRVEDLMRTLMRLASANGGGPLQGNPPVVFDWPKFPANTCDALRRANAEPVFGASAKRGLVADTKNKAIQTDHILVERIHNAIRTMPTVGTYVLVLGDGDYGPVVNTLVATLNKRVILWAVSGTESGYYTRTVSTGYELEVNFVDQMLFSQWGITHPAGAPIKAGAAVVGTVTGASSKPGESRS